MSFTSGGQRQPHRRPPLLGSTSSSSSSFHHKRGPTTGLPGYIVWPAVGVTGTVLCCYYAFLDEAPLSKRRRWIATSPAFERQLGDQEYKNLLRQFRKDILPPHHRASVTVHRVGSRIARASLQLAEQQNLKTVSRAPYTYTVVQSQVANAFVLPNNHVFVLTGLFRYVRDEDELAAVLGHEAAHNLARHAGEKMSGSLVINLLARMLFLVDPSGFLSMLFLPAASVMSDLPHSREAEREADWIGIHLAAEACYDPRAAKRVFGRMQNDSSNNGTAAPPEFLSTHPAHGKRIAQLDQRMPEAMERFEADLGDRCRQVRRDMALARKLAAEEALRREAAGTRAW